MERDLNYTPAEVARLRDDHGARADTMGRVMDDLLTLHDAHAALRADLDAARDERAASVAACERAERENAALRAERDAAMITVEAGASALAASERATAALREQADRMRAVMLAMADGCDGSAYDYEIADAVRGAAPGCDTPNAIAGFLRTLAGEASR